MISSSLRLMPEQPGKGPPSSAPLSVEDADRLAEGFTPFWEDDGVSSATEAPAPVAAPLIPQGSATVTPLGVGPARLTLPKKPTNKQTLLGMAPLAGAPASATAALPSLTTTPPWPITVASPTATPAAAAMLPVAVPALPAAAPALPAAVPALPAAVPALPAAIPVHEAVAAPLAVQGAANVPGYAPKYTPKDGPATPAVVIAPEAQSSPEVNKRPLSTTQPSRVRAAPPAPAPTAPFAASVSDDIDDIYPQKSRTGVWVAAALGAVVLLVAAVLGIRASSEDAPGPGAASGTPLATPAPSMASTAPSAAPEEANAPSPALAAPQAVPSAPQEAAAASEKPKAVAPESPAAHAKLAKAKSEAAPAPHATAHSAATATLPAEPSTPAPKSKSVIVRDAPF